MGLLISVLVGAVVALVFYWVATTLIVFAHSVNDLRVDRVRDLPGGRV